MSNRLYNNQANSRMPFKNGGPTGKKFPDYPKERKAIIPFVL